MSTHLPNHTTGASLQRITLADVAFAAAVAAGQHFFASDIKIVVTFSKISCKCQLSSYNKLYFFKPR